jgi:hypothetical protein
MTSLAEGGKMSKTSLASDSRASARRTWAGNLVSNTARAKHYLHLSAFPCDKCNGPVVVGSLGTREDDICKETAISVIGAVCLACACRPEGMIDPLAGHGFRPMEWEWVIRKQQAAAGFGGESLETELSQDADIGAVTHEPERRPRV